MGMKAINKGKRHSMLANFKPAKPYKTGNSANFTNLVNYFSMFQSAAVFHLREASNGKWCDPLQAERRLVTLVKFKTLCANNK